MLYLEGSGSYEGVLRNVKSVSSDIRNVSGYAKNVCQRIRVMMWAYCELSVSCWGVSASCWDSYVRRCLLVWALLCHTVCPLWTGVLIQR